MAIALEVIGAAVVLSLLYFGLRYVAAYLRGKESKPEEVKNGGHEGTGI